MISRIVKMQFRTTEIDNFKSLFESVKEKIAGFDGNHGVQLVQDHDKPEIFFTLSIWEHSQALENYRNSELFNDTWSKTKAMFDARPEAWSTIVVNQA